MKKEKTSIVIKKGGGHFLLGVKGGQVLYLSRGSYDTNGEARKLKPNLFSKVNVLLPRTRPPGYSTGKNKKRNSKKKVSPSRGHSKESIA